VGADVEAVGSEVTEPAHVDTAALNLAVVVHEAETMAAMRAKRANATDITEADDGSVPCAALPAFPLIAA